LGLRLTRETAWVDEAFSLPHDAQGKNAERSVLDSLMATYAPRAESHTMSAWLRFEEVSGGTLKL
jgi:hypothetical protein